MPSESTVSTARDVRKFAVIQVIVTAVFLALIFWMTGGTGEGYPPIWLVVVLMVAIALGAFFSERVWLTTPPLDPAEDPAGNQERALEIFTKQTVRKLLITESPLILAVVMCFVFDHGGWPILISVVPGLAVMAWEVYPHLRNTSMTAAFLDSGGADSMLVENFLAA